MIRDHNGLWILGYHMRFSHTTPVMTELLALWHGLTIAKTHNVQNLCVETDSAVILQLLNNDHPSYHNLLNECRLLMAETQATILTIFREANTVADILAKEGTKCRRIKSPMLFWHMPHFATSHALLDNEETPSHRTIKTTSILLQGRDVAPNNSILTPSLRRGITPTLNFNESSF